MAITHNIPTYVFLDNKEVKGELLLKELMSHSSNLGNKINVLHFENSRLLQGCQGKRNITDHFCHVDPRGWLRNNSGLVLNKSFTVTGFTA